MVFGLDSGFLSREYAGVPMWGWITGGVGLLFGVSKLRGGGLLGASSAASPPAGTPTGDTGQPGNIFFLPQQGYPNPQQVVVNANPRPYGYPARLKADPNEGPKLPNQSKILALEDESWEDVTARAYGYADMFADAKESDKARIKSVAAFLKSVNGNTPNPKPGQAVYFN